MWDLYTMRQKKSKRMLYILVLAAILLVGFLSSRDLTVHVEQVEETLPNDFLKK